MHQAPAWCRLQSGPGLPASVRQASWGYICTAAARPPWARRASAGGFVIDEEGLGYADIGEEIDWGRGEGAENAAANEPASKGAKAAGGKAGGQKGERAPWLGGERGQAAAACSRGSLRRARLQAALNRLAGHTAHRCALQCRPPS